MSIEAILASFTIRILRCMGMILISVFVLLNSTQAQTWVQQGPGVSTEGQVEGIVQKPVVGAIKTVATHPTDPGTIYVGAVNGGIWKTTNATAANPTWVEQLGTDRSLSIGAIAFDPTDPTNQTLIAGSAITSSFGSRGNDRVGVWRTTNGGTNWTLLNGGGVISDLNITGVAAQGATLVVAAAYGTKPGIWRSTNTGATWNQISGTAETGLPAGTSFDLATDPSNSSRLFTNAGFSGIYRSLNAGATWSKVSNPAMDAILTSGIFNVKISVGRSNNIYVAIVDFSNQLSGLFRSGNGGTTWDVLDLPTTNENGVPVGIHPGEQGYLHLSIAAHLADPNVMFIGGDSQPDVGAPLWFPNSIGADTYSGRLFRIDASRPRGSQSSHITHSNTRSNSSPHPDSRDMAMDAAGNLIETDDGGIYKRTMPLLNTGDWVSLIGDLKTAEFYAIAWDSTSNVVIGGAQDTGTPQQTTTGNSIWESVHVGDGGDVAVNDTGTRGTSIRFTSSQKLHRFQRRKCDASNNCQDGVLIPLTPIAGASPTPQGITPIELNNVDPNRLVIGAKNAVYESMDQGDTVEELFPAIEANWFGEHTLAYGARGNADMLYVGSFDQVFVRTAGSSPLTASPTYPGAGTSRRVQGVTINPTNPQNAFVVDETNVYRTNDAGASWINVTGNLLMLAPGSLRSVAFSPSNNGSVIIGSNNGVFIARGPTFTTWTVLGTGLPRAPVYDLDYDSADQILVAGLLGRGAWTIRLPGAKRALFKSDQLSEKKFAFSVHSGVAISTHGFGSSTNAGLLTEFDFEYRAASKFSLEGVVGRYDFGTPGEIYSTSLLFKGYLPVTTGKFYVTGGPGVFYPTGGTAHFGLNAGAGYNQSINSWLDMEFGASYSNVFRSNAPDLGFIGVRGGVKFKF